MHTIEVKLKKNPYNIIIGRGIMGALGKYLAKLNIGLYAYIVTNPPIKNKYGPLLEKTLKRSGFKAKFKVIPDTEESKSIETATSVIKDIVRFDARQRLFIVAFGGGVVGDLAGFVASIYKRGTAYIQIPTTLLAQVDSAIGGKTAVDLIEGKNLVGAFYQPRLVFSDVNFLKTLDIRQVRSGLAEVIKYGLIKDERLFTYLEKRHEDVLALKSECLEYIVERCSDIKGSIVEKDEREEKGLRTILNFGHTVGHAIEAAAGFKAYNHGEAIALGMLVASDISRSLGLIGDPIYERIENLIKRAGLPLKIKGLSQEAIINAHYRDKKFIGSKNRFVLIRGIGKTEIRENIPLGVIKEALRLRF